MKLIGAALCACLCLAAGSLAARPAELESVTVGVFDVAPFVVAGPDGRPRGILIDYFDKEVAPRMGVRFKWTDPVSVARLEQNLINGKVLFTPILAKTAAREKAKLIFAGNVDIKFEPCIAVRADHPLTTITSTADLAGMTIGWVRSGAIPAFLRDDRIKFDLVSVPDWEQTNLKKLVAGRIQGVFFSDQFTPRYYAARGDVHLKLLTLPTLGTSLYGTFSPKAPANLVVRYEKATREAFAKGRWEAYLDKALAGH